MVNYPPPHIRSCHNRKKVYDSISKKRNIFDNNKNLESEILRTIFIGHQFIYFNLKLFIDFAIYKSNFANLSQL